MGGDNAGFFYRLIILEINGLYWKKSKRMELLDGVTGEAQYAGIDISLEYSNVCVVDADGRVVREAKVLIEPDALTAWFAEHGVAMERIGLEASPLS